MARVELSSDGVSVAKVWDSHGNVIRLDGPEIGDVKKALPAVKPTPPELKKKAAPAPKKAAPKAKKKRTKRSK